MRRVNKLKWFAERAASTFAIGFLRSTKTEHRIISGVRLMTSVELDQRLGEVFGDKPSIEQIAEFLALVERTGAPHCWPPLTTTRHPKGGAPKILAAFSVPARLRGGIETRTPCSICCDKHPKFFEGYLTFLAEEGRLRIMGNRCGRKYFDEGTFLAQEREFNAFKIEMRARLALAGCLGEISALFQECDALGETLRDLIVLKGAVIEALGGRRINALLKSREGTNLLHQLPTERTDDRGNRIWEKRAVATAPGVGAFAHALGFVQQLHRTCLLLAGYLAPVLAGEAVGALSRAHAIAAAEALRSFVRDLELARTAQSDLQDLFSKDTCAALTQWGQHSETTQKFWIERGSTALKGGYGQRLFRSSQPEFQIDLPGTLRALA